jgi:nucleoside-diphosphate-sugar epimerase
MNSGSIFIACGTGYMGSQLVPMLLAQGHEVRALTRIPSSPSFLPSRRPVRASGLWIFKPFAAKRPPAELYRESRFFFRLTHFAGNILPFCLIILIRFFKPRH